MAGPRSIYMGPRLKRMRRELGLTQADMANDLEISPSYIALLERNQRPLTADLILRLASTYKFEIADLATDGGTDHVARLQAMLRDPMFADIDLPALETADVATSYPGITEALLRLYTTYQEEQLALADRAVHLKSGLAEDARAPDPVADVQRFLAARRNCFPQLDDAAERISQSVSEEGGLALYLKRRHNLRIRRLPSNVMAGSRRRFDRHRDAILLDDMLDNASQNFQLALQIVYLELRKDLEEQLGKGQYDTEASIGLIRRSLANYTAAAILMPYSTFARAVETRSYDVEALARQFGTSFEQTAHRLTTLQKPGHERVPFFFIRVDPAGNVSKRLDGAGFPFARHGGACPLWSVHTAFQTPRRVVTQWLELPDGKRFFSIARTVTAGGGAFGATSVERAVALCCAAEHAQNLAYIKAQPALSQAAATPIGISCRLCQRTECTARSAVPIGRQILPDDYRRTNTPYGFSDG